MAFRLSPSEQLQMQQWVAAHGTPQQVALRGRIVLAAAEGKSDVAIAEQFSLNRKNGHPVAPEIRRAAAGWIVGGRPRTRAQADV